MDVDFEVSGELKNYLQAKVFGDMFVEVKIEYRPMFEPREPNDKMALDIVNQKLRYLSGEIAHEVRESLQKHLTSTESEVNNAKQ